MDLKINFKPKFSLSFFKKYMDLVIPVAILLVAILMSIPLLMVRGSVLENMGKSQKDGNSIRSMISNTPSNEQYIVEKTYQDAHEVDAKNLEDMAKQSSQRELLSYEVFPKPKDTSPQIFKTFGKDFREDVLVLMKKLGSRDAPTDSEIKSATGRMSGKTGVVGGVNMYMQGSVKQDDATKVAVDTICKKRSDEISIYASTDVFRWYDYWENFEYDGPNSAVSDCWYSQVAYWIYEDVVDTIVNINGSSKSVSSSYVKRLIGINFDSSVEYPKKQRASSMMPDVPDYVTDRTAGVMAVVPWTGRVCDEDIDVVHFTFAVLINVRSVPAFEKELCSAKTHEFKGFDGKGEVQEFEHNQITVLKHKQRALDLEEKDVHKYYRYGDDALVRLDLTCEYIFNRAGYVDIQPEKIKDRVGQSDRAKQKPEAKDWSNI
ncbi:MAG: hypothetical protein KAS23_03645 [Anaerohalosphaera sp.]|nr:hypothetical protein [Anaerohalosphaera sp.]